MLDEIRQIKSSPRECRRFGVAIGLVLIGLGLWLGWRQNSAAPWVGGTGLLLLLLGSAAPRVLRWLYLVWMTIGLILGTIMSTLLLCLFYLLVLSPLGIVARLAGRDFLQLKRDRAASSYWISRDRSAPNQPGSYEKQF